MLIDRFSDKQIDSHLRDKFSTGITGLPYTPFMRLDQIVGYHYSAIGQSHFSTLIDTVLGALRFVVNAHHRSATQALQAASSILEQVNPLFCREWADGKVSELSLNFSPKKIKVESYKKQYEALAQFFENCGIIPEQTIT